MNEPSLSFTVDSLAFVEVLRNGGIEGLLGTE
jgi:hypothetical protein